MFGARAVVVFCVTAALLSTVFMGPYLTVLGHAARVVLAGAFGMPVGTAEVQRTGVRYDLPFTYNDRERVLEHAGLFPMNVASFSGLALAGRRLRLATRVKRWLCGLGLLAAGRLATVTTGCLVAMSTGDAAHSVWPRLINVLNVSLPFVLWVWLMNEDVIHLTRRQR